MGDVGDLRFDHVQMYMDEVQPLSFYKDLEVKFNKFAAKGDVTKIPVNEARAMWAEINGAQPNPEAYCPSGQDFLEQCIAGLGWRITHENKNNNTTSYAICSPDPNGVRFVVTAPTSHKEEDGSSPSKKKKTEDEFAHFSLDRHQSFYAKHAGRQGIAVLSFAAGKGVIDKIHANYSAKHPALLRTPKVVECGNVRMLEVYSYYLPDQKDKADEGTSFRFIERTSNDSPMLPGLSPVEAVFGVANKVAYSDHWVSNVVDRKQFLTTMEDVLGFTPKVDFNAGVVAAGEAIIESTVTGNTPEYSVSTKAEVLVNQQQIYLPTNNPLSTKGHVHLFVEEMGQGIQHLASRVEEIIPFIHSTNCVREATGKGFSFLRIPRSYYGYLRSKDLVAAGLSEAEAEEVESKLVAASLVDATGIVTLDITDDQIAAAVGAHAKLAAIQTIVKRGRYSNIYNFLRDHVTEEMYLRIVQNKILVDIQGNDVLYQIFTANILQRKEGEEAPFLEFIQRVCSEKKDESGKPVPLRPGCGGFGIRNFLTLFLSIEVSKAMLNLEQAIAAKDDAAVKKQKAMVQAFTDQLNESNPILTDISDAMTAEADALLAAKSASGEAKAKLEAEAEEWRKKKEHGNERLQVCSNKYKELMNSL